MADKNAIREAAKALCEPMLEFTQKLVRLRSDTGQEKQVADAIMEELEALGYDECLRDRTGNVIGIIKGRGDGDSILFNCHMDQVDPGDLTAWEHEPFGGDRDENFIYGRGASDTKGAIATQIYAGAMVKRLEIPLAGDLIFTFVVEEEPGDMWGALRMCQDWLGDRKAALCISGEATGLDLALGHRGRLEIQVVSKGKNSHSSAPWLGINAVSKMAPMIEALDRLAQDLPSDGTFSGSLSIINIQCHPGFNCVVPDTCTINIDRRFTTGETVESMLQEVQDIADRLMENDREASYEVGIRKLEHTSYTGVHEWAEMVKPAFITDRGESCVEKAVEALGGVGQFPNTYFWDFGTDGAYIAKECKIPVIGYSPAEEKYCHQPIDRIDIRKMRQALEGYTAICEEIAGVK